MSFYSASQPEKGAGVARARQEGKEVAASWEQLESYNYAGCCVVCRLYSKEVQCYIIEECLLKTIQWESVDEKLAC